MKRVAAVVVAVGVAGLVGGGAGCEKKEAPATPAKVTTPAIPAAPAPAPSTAPATPQPAADPLKAASDEAMKQAGDAAKQAADVAKDTAIAGLQNQLDTARTQIDGLMKKAGEVSMPTKVALDSVVKELNAQYELAQAKVSNLVTSADWDKALAEAKASVEAVARAAAAAVTQFGK